MNFELESLAFAVLVVQQAVASESMLYEVTIETGMPHMEENLRHAITREARCLSPRELSSAFPVLSLQALEGCVLSNESRREDTVSYVLSCQGGHGTTGIAEWRLGADRISGTLEVKLGGKNMTFYQRITAIPLGRCAGEAK